MRTALHEKTHQRKDVTKEEYNFIPDSSDVSCNTETQKNSGITLVGHQSTSGYYSVQHTARSCKGISEESTHSPSWVRSSEDTTKNSSQIITHRTTYKKKESQETYNNSEIEQDDNAYSSKSLSTSVCDHTSIEHDNGNKKNFTSCKNTRHSNMRL